MTPAGGPPDGEVTDETLATAAAQAALAAPGVLRLHPYAFQAARTVLTAAVRREGLRAPEDADGVAIERTTTSVTAALQVVLAADARLADVAADLAARVRTPLQALSGLDVSVVVNIVDVEPGDVANGR